MIKSIIERAIAALALIVLGLFFLIIALIIKLFMPGPVFFTQQRVGLYGKPFKLIKFRTMRVASGKSKGSFDAGDSSRITPLGRLLRKTKLDELPQLFNVLIGEMSIVGPRPEVKQWTEVYQEKWKIVHSVKPGITDNASIEFRNEEQILAQASDPIKAYRDEILPRKLELYIDYVNHQSFVGDIIIILKTLKAVLLK